MAPPSASSPAPDAPGAARGGEPGGRPAARGLPRRGRLRVYLGAAPGVGKTYAMLGEGRRRQQRDRDVVIAVVETHGRTATAGMADSLEVVPRRVVDHRGTRVEEMDLDAVLARAPQVALVDELAHTNAPGSRNAKRWQDVEELLAAGIDVVTTVNVQHLESLNDVVAQITGVRQRETVPDAVVRAADAIELVDMSPQALRRRLAHGNVYSAERVDAALTNYFRIGNLTALRELALLWVADRVDAALATYRAENGIAAPWAARERIVVALTGGPEGEALLRRGARTAQRAAGGELMALHVALSDGLSTGAPADLTRQRVLAESLGGTWHTAVGDDAAVAILDFARGVNATQVVLGASRRGRLAAALRLGVGQAVINGSGDIDVQIVTHDHAGRGRQRRRSRSPLSAARRVAGWVVALLVPPLLGLALSAATGTGQLSVDLMAFLALTVAVALLGGFLPAVACALWGGLVSNYLLVPPLHTLAIRAPSDAVAVLLLVAVAAGVSWVVDLGARRTQEAARASTEAEALATLAGSVLRGQDAVPALLERLREMYAMPGVSLLERPEVGGEGSTAWSVVAGAGAQPPLHPEEGATAITVREGLVLALGGQPLAAQDLRVATAVAVQLGTVLERDRLRESVRDSRREAQRTAVRTALLAAVSHDLRTPLAGIKASTSALRATDVQLGEEDRAVLLAGVEDSADQLQSLIDNLLDMSRLDAGAVSVRLAPVALDEVVPQVLSMLAPPEQARVWVDVPEDLPLVLADAGLLERALGNVVENALRHSPEATPVRISAGALGDQLVVRVVDRGPGIPDERKQAAFAAFQRLGDAPAGHGVGLGLAVARGFTQACNGQLDAEDTPGGGLTMVFSLPVAPVALPRPVAVASPAAATASPAAATTSPATATATPATTSAAAPVTRA